MSYTTYEFTAFTEADLLNDGDGNLNCGDTFTMPADATTCISVSDNDAFLSGDNYCDENANDSYGQQATITGEDGNELGNGGQIYAESYWWVYDQHGNWYVLIEIEQEGSGEDYFTFYTGGGYTVPAEGAELTVHSSCNVTGDWVDYKCLDAGEKPAQDAGSISGRLYSDADCDNTELNADTGEFEEGIGGETVTLYGWNGSSCYVVATTTTNDDGSYSFGDLAEGWYFVQFDAPQGASFVEQNVGPEGEDSDANQCGNTQWIWLDEGENETNVDAGVKQQPGWIKGRLTLDADCNDNEWNDQTGQWDEGIAGQTVQLVDLDGNVVATSVTDGYGNYMFDVAPGQYRVKFPLLEGFKFSAKDSGVAEHFDSDADENGLTDVITVVSGQAVHNIDAGLKPEPAAIAGRYFCDENDNSVDDDEAGIAGATVELLDAAGNVVATTMTGSDGSYEFTGLAAGDYSVRFAPDVDGKTFVNRDAGDNDEIDSDVNAITGETGVITVAAGERSEHNDAGVEEVDPGNGGDCAFFIQGPVLTRVMLDEQPDGSIKVTVDVLDATGQIGDLRGVFFEMADESLLPLLNIAGADVGNVVIDANNVTDVGNGSNLNGEVVRNFGEFDVGVEIGTPGATPDDIRSTMFTISRSDGIKLEADDFSFTDFGIRLTSVGEEGGAREDSLKIGGTVPLIVCEKAGSLSGTYFCDDDRDGVDDGAANGDADIAGKLVTLLNADGTAAVDMDGNAVDPVLTDEFGNYRFDNLAAGDYVVMFEGTDGKAFIAPNVGDDDAVDSDVVDAANGKTAAVTVLENQETTDVDAGVAELLGSISGRYFCDENRDGTELDDAGNFEAGVANATVWLLLQGSGVIARTTTDADGNYSFDGLSAGNYTVRFEDPDDVSAATEGKNFIAANQGDDATDSDVVNVGGAGNGNTATITLGAGENKTDVDAGIEQQFMACDDPNAVLLDFEGFAAGTVVDDEYAQFGVTISAQRATNNTAANDAMIFDSANPTGGDGDLQTFNQGNLLIVSEDNDSSDPDDAVGGVITFDFANPSRIFDLKVVDTEEGGTVALFDADGNSLGVIALPNLADGGLEQVMIDVDGVSRMVVTLNGSGAIDDICIVPGQPEPGSLSGTYFCDDDRDGIDDGAAAGDADIAGKTVTLLNADGSPVLDIDGNVVDPVLTDANGDYRFDNLAAGDYVVMFEAVAGKSFIAPNAGDDAVDSDVVDTVNGKTAPVTVVAGEETKDVDAGVQDQPGSISGTYFCDDDRDGIDDGAAAGDADIAGKTVMLLDANGDPATDIDGNPVAAAVTDANGNYSFVNLAAGFYVVMFESSAAEGKSFIAPNAGDDAVDSDVIDAANGKTGLVEVFAGQETKDVDAGVEDQAGSISGTYFCDDDRDGVDDGADLGDADIAGKTVMLLNLDGTQATDIDGNPVAAVLTDANGDYSFDNLGAGDYVVMFEATDGKSFIAADQGGDDRIDSDVDENGKVTVTVEAGEDTGDVDAGVSTDLGSLSGRYFCDDDGDGLDNDGLNGGPSDGVEGILVELLDANGDPTGRTELTGPNGEYSFAGLLPGTYGVRFNGTPADKGFTIVNVDGDVSDDIDSDAIADDFGTATISNIVVVGNQDTPDNDVGVTPLNGDPEAADVAAAVCADEMATINLLDAVSDPDGDMVSIASISDADETAGVGGSITLEGGGVVTLNADGTVTFDPNGAYDDLVIRAMEMEQFQFTAVDENGAFSEPANADIKVCGALNTVETIAEGLEGVTATVSIRLAFLEGGLYEATVDSDDDRLDGVFAAAYCVDVGDDLVFDQTFDANVYLSVDGASDTDPDNVAALPDGIVANEENLDLVNWILNQRFENVDSGTHDAGGPTVAGQNYSLSDIQTAIWSLVNEDTFTFESENAQELRDLALSTAEAEGFIPGEGDLVGVILDPINVTPDIADDLHEQPFIIGIDFEVLKEECDCVL